jgi:hypothetical protein
MDKLKLGKIEKKKVSKKIGQWAAAQSSRPSLVAHLEPRTGTASSSQPGSRLQPLDREEAARWRPPMTRPRGDPGRRSSEPIRSLPPPWKP